jgi:hypothetical protein
MVYGTVDIVVIIITNIVVFLAALLSTLFSSSLLTALLSTLFSTSVVISVAMVFIIIVVAATVVIVMMIIMVTSLAIVIIVTSLASVVIAIALLTFTLALTTVVVTLISSSFLFHQLAEVAYAVTRDAVSRIEHFAKSSFEINEPRTVADFVTSSFIQSTFELRTGWLTSCLVHKLAVYLPIFRIEVTSTQITNDSNVGIGHDSERPI